MNPWPAPGWTLRGIQPGGAEELFALASYGAAGRCAALVFYSHDFGPQSTQVLLEFQRLAAEFDDAGTDLLALSGDSLHAHRAWSGLLGLHFPLLSDPGLEVAALYGAALPEQYCAQHAAFLIDRAGRVRWQAAGEGTPPNAADMLAAAETLRL